MPTDAPATDAPATVAPATVATARTAKPAVDKDNNIYILVGAFLLIAAVLGVAIWATITFSKSPPDDNGNGNDKKKECDSGHTCIPDDEVCGPGEICYNPDDFDLPWSNEYRLKHNPNGPQREDAKIEKEYLDDLNLDEGYAIDAVEGRNRCHEISQQLVDDGERVCGINFYPCAWDDGGCNGDDRSNKPCIIYANEDCNDTRLALPLTNDISSTFIYARNESNGLTWAFQEEEDE